MSKQMTPCEKLGYKVGDKFEVLTDDDGFEIGSIVELWHDDDSICPLFRGKGCDGEYLEIYLNACQPENGVVVLDVKKVDETKKLKPAKQALADAIHQNGGWSVAGDCNFVTSNRSGVVKFFNQNPLRNGADWVSCPYSLSWIDLHQQLPNWHQTILSRDEYFTAYPERVNVEIGNETKHKVEVEMKSESEMTINANDWHKNGELPPVGVGVQLWHGGAYAYDCEVIAKRGNSYVLWNLTLDRADSADCSMCDFRPIRTEREKAIDEMVGEFINYYGDPKGGERHLGIAEKLYDAGYRKEVK